MTYRITLSSNPRIVLLFFIIVALPAAGIISLFLLPIFLGIVLTVLGVYLAYHLGKFLLRSLLSRIETSDEQVKFNIGYKDAPVMRWEDITLAGSYVEGSSRPHLFVYDESDDNLITIPPDYAGFEQLVEEIKARTDFEEITLNESQTLAEHLKDRLGMEEEEIDDEEEEPETDNDESSRDVTAE